MKAGNFGTSGHGRLMWMAAAAAALLIAVVLVSSSCGGDDGTETSASQLDDESGQTSTRRGVTTVSGASGAEVLPGYSEDQCVAEMTVRYGSEETARQVCDTLQADYGASSQPTEVMTVLPQVEQELGVTPIPGTPTPGQSTGGSGGTDGDGGTGGGDTQLPPPPDSGGSSGDGWDSGGIEITVPSAP